MPPRQPAAILIQREKPYPDRQESMCHQYAERHDLRVAAICFRWPDSYVMVVNRTVRVVICATYPGDDLVERVESAGGRVCVVRQGSMPEPRLRRDVAALAKRMSQRGYDTQEIAALLEVDSGEIRRTLRRNSRE